MADLRSDVTCALSGLLPAPDEELDAPPQEDDDLGDLPLGWAEVTLRWRTPSPEYAEVREAQAFALQVLTEGFGMPKDAPKDERRRVRRFLRLQALATFHSLLAATPPYDVHEITFTLAARDATVRKALALAVRDLDLPREAADDLLVWLASFEVPAAQPAPDGAQAGSAPRGGRASVLDPPPAGGDPLALPPDLVDPR